MLPFTISENCRDARLGARKVEMCSLTIPENDRDPILGARKVEMCSLTISEIAGMLYLEPGRWKCAP